MEGVIMGEGDSSARDAVGHSEGPAAPALSAAGGHVGPLMTVEQRHVDLPVRPRVTGPLPGPRSAELLIRQDRRESNARVYPRHIPIAVDEARGSFVRDLD